MLQILRFTFAKMSRLARNDAWVFPIRTCRSGADRELPEPAPSQRGRPPARTHVRAPSDAPLPRESNIRARRYEGSRVNVAIQFGSQVLPPSSENACSSRNDVCEMSEKMKRA
jgi:hypothetical protein